MLWDLSGTGVRRQEVKVNKVLFSSTATPWYRYSLCEGCSKCHFFLSWSVLWLFQRQLPSLGISHTYVVPLTYTIPAPAGLLQLPLQPLAFVVHSSIRFTPRVWSPSQNNPICSHLRDLTVYGKFKHHLSYQMLEGVVDFDRALSPHCAPSQQSSGYRLSPLGFVGMSQRQVLASLQCQGTHQKLSK